MEQSMLRSKIVPSFAAAISEKEKSFITLPPGVRNLCHHSKRQAATFAWG